MSDSYITSADERRVRARRVLYTILTCATAAGMAHLMALTLFAGPPDPFGIAMLLAFLATLPWTVVSFWNAVIGLALMVCARDPNRTVAPWLPPLCDEDPVTAATALLVCVRNEDAQRLRRNLGWMTTRLAHSAPPGRFHLYVLSDSSDPALFESEARIAAELAARLGASLPVTYRRREQRAGYKAGNIRDFCERWGQRHDYAIVLDADSLMTAEAMLRLVRIMQRSPRLGILQTLVTGLPSASAFARVFQFGMRLGMRSYTLGSAWWQADCGPYWGHNAIIRLAPFIEHCDMPRLPGGAHVLSHDQIEAVLMRRAGYEVHVLIDQGGSWEENPPHLAEFVRRDLRWCQGNMQYVHLIGMPGLPLLSRIQIALAIAMYLSPLGWIAFLMLGALRGLPIREDTGLTLFSLTLVMTFAPKLATLVEVLARSHLRAAYGGTARIVLGAVVETVFWTLLAPVCAVAVAIFLVGLPFGLQTGWTSQERDAVGLPLAAAARKFWPQTILGLALLTWLIATAPGAFWWLALPVYAALSLCVPVATLTAHPAVGRFLQRAGLCRIPEEAQPELDIGLPRPFAPLVAATRERAP